MTQPIRIEYRSMKTGKQVHQLNSTLVPRVGENVELRGGTYEVKFVTWVENSVVVLEVSEKLKIESVIDEDSRGNW